MAKLYKGSVASSVGNSKRVRGASGGLAIPYQPVRSGAKVLGSRKTKKEPKGGEFKLKIKTK